MIDEMLERHRWGVDDMVEVVHRFRRRRIAAEWVQVGLILAGLDYGALSEWRRNTSLKAHDRKRGRLID